MLVLFKTGEIEEALLIILLTLHLYNEILFTNF